MRAFMILVCAALSAWAAVVYARSAESVGVDIAGYGVNYSHPNFLALGAAVLFGILAIALAIEGLALAQKNRPQAPPQTQIVIVQQPAQTPSPDKGGSAPRS